MPVATNCSATPAGIDVMAGFAGVTDMEVRVAEFTFRAVLAEMPPNTTVIVVAPGETVITTPVLLTVAMAGLEEVQVTWVVRSKLVPSE